MPVRVQAYLDNWYAWVVDEVDNDGNIANFVFRGNAAYLHNFLQGGIGNDTITGIASHNRIHGFAGNDSIIGTVSGYNALYGDQGNDTITGGINADCIYGGQGNDLLEGRGGNDVITGGVGIDTIYGGDGDDIIEDDGSDGLVHGGNGNDDINVELSNGLIYGDDGNDQITVRRPRTALPPSPRRGVIVQDGNGDDVVNVRSSHIQIESDRGADLYQVNDKSYIKISYHNYYDSTTTHSDTITGFDGRLDDKIDLWPLTFSGLDHLQFAIDTRQSGNVVLRFTGDGSSALHVNCGDDHILRVLFRDSHVTRNDIVF